MPDPPTVTITILAYRSKATIRQCLTSALGLEYAGPLEILIREQGGDDEEFRLLQEMIALVPWSPHRRVVASRGENLGFAGGHNALIRESSAEFFVCLNADAVLTPAFLGAALEPFSDQNVGAVQGKLLRYDFEKNTPQEKVGKAVIDTTGLLMFKNRRIVNRGQGEPDTGQYDREEEVFGVDGAVPVYRKKALDDIAVPLRVFSRETSRSSAQNSTEVEFFDENFFLYKEDVDLAWRLRLGGWKTTYTPKAVAYHGRGSGDSMASTPWGMIRERRKINPRAKFYSFRNQRLMQLKNELPGIFVRHLPWFLPKEIAAWGYALLYEGTVVPRAVRDWLSLVPKMMKKRRYIMSRRRASAKDLSRWFM